ncbi:hypothetical protein D3C81_178980 [compost metagenome]
MTDDEQTLLMFRGLVASMAPAQQENYRAADAELRRILATYPGGEAFVALAALGAELQCNGGKLEGK